VLRLQGELDAALASYQAGRAIAASFVAADPGNSGWQRGLAVSHIKIGDMLALQAKPDEALASYRASHAIAERFAETGDAGWQNDLGISHERIVCVLESQGEPGRRPEGLTGRTSRSPTARRRRPRQCRPAATLGIAYEHIGDVLRALDDLDGCAQGLRRETRHHQPPGGRRPRQCGLAVRSRRSATPVSARCTKIAAISLRP